MSVVLQDVVAEIIAIDLRVARRDIERADATRNKAIEILLRERMLPAAIESRLARLLILSVNVEFKRRAMRNVPMPIGINTPRSSSDAARVVIRRRALLAGTQRSGKPRRHDSQFGNRTKYTPTIFGGWRFDPMKMRFSSKPKHFAATKAASGMQHQRGMHRLSDAVRWQEHAELTL